MLQSYKSALVRHETAAIELGEQIENQKTSEMTAKYKECNEAERQLTQIETRLGELSYHFYHHLPPGFLSLRKEEPLPELSPDAGLYLFLATQDPSGG